MSFRIEEAGTFRAQVKFLNIKMNDGAVENKHVAEGAGLSASKLEHQHRAVLAQESATAAEDQVQVVHVVKGTAGKALEFKCGCVVKATDGDVIDFDLLKNGVSMLTGVVRVDSGDANYALLAGTIDAAKEDLVAGDVIEIEIDVTADGGDMAKGAFAFVDLEEDYD